MHITNIRIHFHLVVDIIKEKISKHGYQTETSGDNDR